MKYDWLKRASKQIKTNNFFVFQHDFAADYFTQLHLALSAFPRDYVEFLKTFGDARMFRDLSDGFYQLAVFSKPKRLKLKDDVNLVQIGFFVNGGYACYREEGGAPTEPCIYEDSGDRMRKAAPSFESWIQMRYEAARKLYKKKDWQLIVDGPAPFTPEEIEVVNAIPHFTFRKVGVADAGNILVEVHNGSPITLKRLTVGVRVPGKLEGGAYLDVSEIGPGETKTVEHECYKRTVNPNDVELFRKPLPGPEERQMYRELRGGH